MIRHCGRMPPFAASDAETLIGCRMQTLDACYGGLKMTAGAPDWYTEDWGGVLCRFGAALLVAGDVDFDALFSFAALLGVSRIEWLSPHDQKYYPPADWEIKSHPVLCRTGEEASAAITIQAPADLRRCFALLCASDASFAREADYLPWLSDMTRRRNRGRAEAFLYDDAAVACVTAKSAQSAYLSSVAVCPERRGEGLGLDLLRAVVSHPALRGRTIYTAAQSEPLAAFYQKAGFAPLPQRLTVTEKRTPT